MRQQKMDGWLDANQRYLSLAIARIRALPARHEKRATSSMESPAEYPQAAAGCELDPPSALESVGRTFGLSDFERAVLVLCAGCELDADVSSQCGRAQGDSQRGYPTFGLALAALDGAHWSAVLPESPLRRWHLIEYATGGLPSAPITTRPLRIDERVLHVLTGLDAIDERLAAVATPVAIDHELVPTHQQTADRIIAAWMRPSQSSGMPVIALYGPDVLSARAIAAHACRTFGWRPYVMNDSAIPANQHDLHLLVTLWAREMRLGSAALMLETAGAGSDPSRDAIVRGFVDRLTGPLVVISRERQELGPRRTASFEIVKPTAGEQERIWLEALPAGGACSLAELRVLTSQFSLNVPEIQSAAEEALSHADAVPASSAQRLWNACRQQSRGRLDDL